MNRTSRIKVWAFALALGVGNLGCRSMDDARYVYQDGEYGVVGIPEGTSIWPHYYRDQAERLMAEHFPTGYEIIRAEEVPEGSRTLTTGGTTSAELAPSLSGEVGGTVGKLGRTSIKTQADTLKIKEYRIIYRKSPVDVPNLYAEEADTTPPLYVDANAAERRAMGEAPTASAEKTARGTH